MNKEILLVVDAVSHEKGVDKTVIFEALECALASATKKRYGADWDVVVEIDRDSGDYHTFRRWEVVNDEELRFPDSQKGLSEAREEYGSAQIGTYLIAPMQSVEFGRIAAQTARQVIVQKVREAERMQIVGAYRNRVGQLISGTVKRLEKGNVIIDVGDNADAIIPRDQLIPKESMRVGDRVRGYLQIVRPEARGPQLFLSRTAPEMLEQLFHLEVPEINEGLLGIMGAARDPGVRAKIGVKARDPRIDAVGACVGLRGSRVQAVSNELCGERIDIILWDDNPAQYVLNAMSPVDPVSIVIDEETHTMDVAVADEDLSQAIGKGGQNVKLASQLTGWNINVMSVSQATEKNQAESQTLQQLFISQLAVDEDVAAILVEEGFSSVEEVAYVPIQEMLEIEAFDEEIVQELRTRARDVLLLDEIASEERAELLPANDLLDLPGMDAELATKLAAQGICTADDLAEQAVDDLVDDVADLDRTRAAELIMAARAAWFADEDQVQK
jgi:transcription termination/antitermination protein NusA